MDRLRPLTEADCYRQLYGEREPTIAVIRNRVRSTPFGMSVSGDDLRRAFEERLDQRGPDESHVEAA
jgi:hypothetical protein